MSRAAVIATAVCALVLAVILALRPDFAPSGIRTAGDSLLASFLGPASSETGALLRLG